MFWQVGATVPFKSISIRLIGYLLCINGVYHDFYWIVWRIPLARSRQFTCHYLISVMVSPPCFRFYFFRTTGVLTDSWAVENENWQSTKSIPCCREPALHRFRQVFSWAWDGINLWVNQIHDWIMVSNADFPNCIFIDFLFRPLQTSPLFFSQKPGYQQVSLRGERYRSNACFPFFMCCCPLIEISNDCKKLVSQKLFFDENFWEADFFAWFFLNDFTTAQMLVDP